MTTISFTDSTTERSSPQTSTEKLGAASSTMRSSSTMLGGSTNTTTTPGLTFPTLPIPTTPTPASTAGPTTPVPTLGNVLSRRFAVRSFIHVEQEMQSTYMMYIGRDALPHNITIARQCPSSSGMGLFGSCADCDNVIATDDYSSLRIPLMPLSSAQKIAIRGIITINKSEYQVNVHMDFTIPICLDKGFIRERLIKRAASAPRSVLGNHDMYVGNIEKCSQKIQYASPEIYGCHNLTHTTVLNQHIKETDNNLSCLKVREVTCTLFKDRFKKFYPNTQNTNIEACGFVNFDEMNIGIFTYCDSVVSLRGRWDNFPSDHTIAEDIIKVIKAMCGAEVVDSLTGDKIWANQRTCKNPAISRITSCELVDAPTTPSSSATHLEHMSLGTMSFLLGATSFLLIGKQ